MERRRCYGWIVRKKYLEGDLVDRLGYVLVHTVQCRNLNLSFNGRAVSLNSGWGRE